jgi:hypothetical protein
VVRHWWSARIREVRAPEPVEKCWQFFLDLSDVAQELFLGDLWLMLVVEWQTRKGFRIERLKERRACLGAANALDDVEEQVSLCSFWWDDHTLPLIRVRRVDGSGGLASRAPRREWPR